jgi:hypothetical protein
MALLDLKTDLKSLKYGRDTPGGGDSGQPYIQANIPTGDTVSVPFDDGFIRGGAVGAARASIADLKRISSFFKSKPQGTLFIARQVGLQLSNPRPEVIQDSTNLTLISTNRGENQFLPNNKKAGFEDIGATRTYNLGLNTLAQVPVNAFGVHFYRHGLTPVFGDAAKYENVATVNNQGANAKFNKLVSIATKFELGGLQSPNNPARINIFDNSQSEFLPLEDARRSQRASRRVFRRDLRAAGVFERNTTVDVRGGIPGGLSRKEARTLALDTYPKINPATLIVDRYIGGPGSVYGVGETIIPRRSNTADKFKIENALENASIFGGKAKDTEGNPIELDYGPLVGNIANYDDQIPTTNEDIRKGIDQKAINLPFISPFSANYSQLKLAVDKNKTNTNYTLSSTTVGNKTGLTAGYVPLSNYTIDLDKRPTYNGSTGTIIINSPWKNVNREINVGSGTTDSVNLVPLYLTSGVVPNGFNSKDFVEFIIGAIGGSAMRFRAYLTQFSDSVDAKWSGINYVGRGEEFYIYGGFSRKINIGFKVAALSEKEMEPIYQKLNYLMGNLMPDYNGLLMRGPFVQMTVGNWLSNQDGILNNLSYTIPQDSPWEINLPIAGNTTGSLVLPHIVEVQMTFTPIGSQTKGANQISERSTKTSHIAQNIGNLQYIK